MRKWNKRGQVFLYLILFASMTFVIVISALLAPIGVELNTKFYLAGQDILNDSLDDIAGISDPTIREQVNASVLAAQGQAANNIEINAALYQYGWVLVLIVSGLAFFLVARQLVSLGGGQIG